MYAKELEGLTFYDIKKRYFSYYNRLNELNLKTEDTNAKGQLGNFLEEYYFAYKPNYDQEADFREADVKLKKTCIDTKKNGEYTAGEHTPPEEDLKIIIEDYKKY